MLVLKPLPGKKVKECAGTNCYNKSYLLAVACLCKFEAITALYRKIQFKIIGNKVKAYATVITKLNIAVFVFK